MIRKGKTSIHLLTFSCFSNKKNSVFKKEYLLLQSYPIDLVIYVPLKACKVKFDSGIITKANSRDDFTKIS